MDKAKWGVMEARRKDGLVLTTLWKAENGKPIDIHWNEVETSGTCIPKQCYPEYIPSGKPWKTHGECDAVAVPYFTTDRNACALVVAEIKTRGKDVVQQMLVALAEGTGLLPRRDGVMMTMDVIEADEALWCGLNADPDTICYCAIKAVEDVTEE